MKLINEYHHDFSNGYDYSLDNDTHFSYLEMFNHTPDKGTCVRVNADGSTLTNADMRGDLSQGSTSVVLHFEAEQGLEYDRVIALVQHEGKTFVSVMSETDYQNKKRFGK